MADKRLIELALKGLEAEKEKIDREIAQLRGRSGPRKSASTSAPKRRRRKFTAAQRKASSLRMKKYWADKKRGK